MSTVAAGAYLQTLRTSAGLSQKDVAKLLKTSDSQIDRIERGQTNTRGTVWFQVAEILAANLYELSQLLTDTSASKEEGVMQIVRPAHFAAQVFPGKDERRMDGLPGKIHPSAYRCQLLFCQTGLVLGNSRSFVRIRRINLLGAGTQ